MTDRAIRDWDYRPVQDARCANAPHRVRLIAHLAAIVCCGGLASGCSLSLPMAGLGTDELATGTIKSRAVASPLSAEMDAEDWRRAKSALDTALDPQGNGASVAWDNPASGAKGSFLPLAQPYPKDDGICRPFTARINMKGQAEHVVQSSACRVNSGDWIVGHVSGAAKPLAKQSRTSLNLADRDRNTQLK